MPRASAAQVDQRIAGMDAEQLPAGEHEQHGPGHFAGLYAAENVAGTEFIFGATFVVLGASMKDVLIGLLVGNLLAVLTFRFVTAPIAVRTRMSVYTYLSRVAGGATSKLFNALNAFLFAIIAAAMITVSATALRLVLDFPAQTEAYPTSAAFVVLALAFGLVAVLVAAFGFNALAEFASTCAPWLVVMFATGGLVLLPAVAQSVTGSTVVGGWSGFVQIGEEAVFTGRTPDGGAGISLVGIIGFSWAANSFAHAGLIDMSLLRYARKSRYGYTTATGMLIGHYTAWVSAGVMGAAAAAITTTSIEVIEPGTVAFEALGHAGLATVVVAGWTTANANLYRSGLAGQGVFPKLSRQKVTLITGVVVVAAAAFPFVYRNYLIFVTYAGIALVPIGGILFAEHHLLPRLGMTRFWARYKGVTNVPALLAWGTSIAAAATAVALGLMPEFIAFVPAFLLSAALYVLLARRMGATGNYPEGEAADEFFQERVDAFHAEQAARTPAGLDTRDRRRLTRVLRVVWIVDLVVVFAAALLVLLSSPDVPAYEARREQFWAVAAAGTVVYFTCAYWELRRRKGRAKEALVEHRAQQSA
ncbi:purine-cytosine permease family protein [Kineococcus terrestris]|uniref:purine-cytosine permease family protein n=1 Tax=Kineococcus terrestris TaxID=2044856 RepID=UPI0034DABD96